MRRGCLQLVGGVRLGTADVRDEARVLGYLGEAALEMLRNVFVEQLPRFPSLDHVGEVDDLVQDFFVAKGEGYVPAVMALPDDAAVRRLTRSWVEHWLVDRVRERPWGALRHRLEKRLQRSDLFTTSVLAHYWMLAGGVDADVAVGDDELRAIAASAPVGLLYSSSGDGSVQLGRAGQLEEMLRRVLEASGRLHISELTRVCADRFPSLLDNADASDEAADVDWDVIAETVASPDGAGDTDIMRGREQVAAQLLSTLDGRERVTVRFLDDAQGLVNELGVGRSSAYSLIAKVRGRLIEAAGDHVQGRHVVAALLGLIVDDATVVPFSDDMTTEASGDD